MNTIIAVGIIGAILTFARRWNNPDPDAGAGIAAWTIILMLISLSNNIAK